MTEVYSIGAPLRFFFEKVLLIIQNPEVPFIIATFMVIFGIYIYFYYWIKSRKLNRELFETISFIKGSIIPNEEEKLELIGPPNLFNKKYEVIKNVFETTHSLKDAFSEYSETLIIPKPKDDDQFIQNSIRPHDHFNGDLFETTGINPRTALAWPNYFIGFGLLITFIGLVGALDVASSGLQEVGSSSPQGMQQILKELLSTASFKFITSVFGILISLILGYLFNKLFHNIDKKIAELNVLIEKGVIYTFSEKILLKISELSEESLATQRNFRDSLGTALGDSLKPLNNTLSEFAEKISSLNTDAMSDMIKEFEKSISSSATDHIENVSKSLLMVSDTLSSFSKNTDQVSNQFKDDVSRASNSLIDAINEFRNILSDSNKEFREVSDSIKRLHEETATTVASISGISDGIKNTGETLEISSNKMAGISNEMGELLDKYKDTNNEIANVVQKIESSFGTIDNTLNQSFNKISETWNKYDINFSNFGDQTEKAYKEFGSAISSQVANIQDFAVQIDKNFGEAIDKLAPQIQSMQDAVESLPIDELGNSLDQSIIKFKNINIGLLEKIEEGVINIEKNQSKLQDQLDDVRKLERSPSEE